MEWQKDSSGFSYVCVNPKTRNEAFGDASTSGEGPPRKRPEHSTLWNLWQSTILTEIAKANDAETSVKLEGLPASRRGTDDPRAVLTRPFTPGHRISARSSSRALNIVVGDYQISEVREKVIRSSPAPSRPSKRAAPASCEERSPKRKRNSPPDSGVELASPDAIDNGKRHDAIRLEGSISPASTFVASSLALTSDEQVPSPVVPSDTSPNLNVDEPHAKTIARVLSSDDKLMISSRFSISFLIVSGYR